MFSSQQTWAAAVTISSTVIERVIPEAVDLAFVKTWARSACRRKLFRLVFRHLPNLYRTHLPIHLPWSSEHQDGDGKTRIKCCLGDFPTPWFWPWEPTSWSSFHNRRNTNVIPNSLLHFWRMRIRSMACGADVRCPVVSTCKWWFPVMKWTLLLLCAYLILPLTFIVF